jgi:hypothetical protein
MPANRRQFAAVSDFIVTLSGHHVGGTANSSVSLTRLILSTHSNGKSVTNANRMATM